jgi:outer membrane protein OmpA-like peptidoglycan-associated protein
VARTFRPCSLEAARIVTHGILFDTCPDILKPESGPGLRSVLELLQQDEKLSFAIEGHTDNRGDRT